MTTPPCWHALTGNAALKQLGSAENGLDSSEAARRLKEHGANELQAAHRASPWVLLYAQFKNLLIIILLMATLLSALLGHGIEAIAITVIVLFAVLLGFVQEFRAERAMEALRNMAAPSAIVLRDGAEFVIPARELVPGDVVLLKAGALVPADLRLLETVNLQVNEAPLTGESLAIDKQTTPLTDAALPVGDRRNLAFAGTTVTIGRGRGAVVATGMDTEFGKIAGMLQKVESGRTPLQENLDRVGHSLARAALIVVALIVALGLWRGQPFIDMLIFGIALAVAVVPEALPAVVTISLAIGVQRMVRRHALVRRLAAVETLGSTSVICTDKTGTLTRDEMTVRRVFTGGTWYDVDGSGYAPLGSFWRDGTATTPDDSLLKLLQAAVLVNDAQLENDPEQQRWQIKGDPTEGALVVAAAKAGIDKVRLDAEYPRLFETPFTPEHKRMVTVHRFPDGDHAFIKGAPEVVLGSCSSQASPSGKELLDEDRRETILAAAQAMAGAALRVLAVATRTAATRKNTTSDLTFLGLFGMSDPPRAEAKEAIQTCRKAGIRPVMITGDHPLTARAVAQEIDLLGDDLIVTGAEVERMSDDELVRQAPSIAVYARVSPAHKLRVVTALQQCGEITAMTGDGVNDAPALKKADIGIAMGLSGTDVTREAADLTLTDDNFASIVAAIEEGRIIFGNIRKYLMYLLSSNIGEIGLMAGATLLGLPLPLTAVQLLYVNLATDGLPALALAVDPPEDDLMQRRPRDPRRGLFTRPVVILMLAGGVWSTMINLGLFIWALHSGRPQSEAMTMTFVSLVLIQFFKAYNFRSDHLSVLHRPFANRWLNLAIGWELLLLGVVVYLPLLQHPFNTFSLTPNDWLIILVASGTVSPVLELVKWLGRRNVAKDAGTA